MLLHRLKLIQIYTTGGLSQMTKNLQGVLHTLKTTALTSPLPLSVAARFGKVLRTKPAAIITNNQAVLLFSCSFWSISNLG